MLFIDLKKVLAFFTNSEKVAGEKKSLPVVESKLEFQDTRLVQYYEAETQCYPPAV